MCTPHVHYEIHKAEYYQVRLRLLREFLNGLFVADGTHDVFGGRPVTHLHSMGVF